jgi:hypothetical protein
MVSLNSVIADKAIVDSEFAEVRGNFSVPILIGEYGTYSVGSAIEKAAGWAVSTELEVVLRRKLTSVDLTVVRSRCSNGHEVYNGTSVVG